MAGRSSLIPIPIAIPILIACRPLSPRPIFTRHKHIPVRELLKQGRGLAEVRGQHVKRVAGDPLREVDRRVYTRVESDQHAARLGTHVFNRVPVPLRNVTDVAFGEGLGPVPAVRAKHRDADIAVDDVMPFVGGRVPVKLSQCPSDRGRGSRR